MYWKVFENKYINWCILIVAHLFVVLRPSTPVWVSPRCISSISFSRRILSLSSLRTSLCNSTTCSSQMCPIRPLGQRRWWFDPHGRREGSLTFWKVCDWLGIVDAWQEVRDNWNPLSSSCLLVWTWRLSRDDANVLVNWSLPGVESSRWTWDCTPDSCGMFLLAQTLLRVDGLCKSPLKDLHCLLAGFAVLVRW